MVLNLSVTHNPWGGEKVMQMSCITDIYVIINSSIKITVMKWQQQSLQGWDQHNIRNYIKGWGQHNVRNYIKGWGLHNVRNYIKGLQHKDPLRSLV